MTHNPTRTIHVATDRPYDVVIASGQLDNGLPAGVIAPDQAWRVISDSHVAALYGARFGEPYIVPAGEDNKTLQHLDAMLQDIAASGLRRDGVLIALGGGVIGDMVGLAAALWMRGIEFVQIPTTLLAMVDSSVGGKTAVDLPQGKNLVGAFHQPTRVLIDPLVLSTLPAAEFAAGMAEVIKYAAILDAPMATWLQTNADAIRAKDADVLTQMIARCVQHKADIVQRDPHERGERALLNLGHTFGHAIESEMNFAIRHGHAVAIGMVLAARLSEQLRGAPSADTATLIDLLNTFDLPTTVPTGLNANALVQRMRLDKKADRHGLRLVLWDGWGRAVVQPQVPESAVLGVLDAG